MKRVCLVTFFENNYGSALQSYATKYYLLKKGIYCDIVYPQNTGFEKFKNRIAKAYRILLNSIKYKNYYRDIKKYRVAISCNKNYLTKISRTKIHNFAVQQLCTQGKSFSELKESDKSNEYYAFIAGSDQIWNASHPINEFYFLHFVKKSKKISIATSFGNKVVKKYNQQRINHLLKDFSAISVREAFGEKIVKAYAKQHCDVVCDPTILLTDKEWHEFGAECELSIDYEYILCHFIDEPNEMALRYLKSKIELFPNISIIIAGYNHYEFDKFNYKFIDADPHEFVYLVDKANVVLTDSFHTSLFSLYFKKEFFVYQRNYKVENGQEDRIHTLLNKYKCPNRYINSNNDQNNNYKVDREYIDKTNEEQRQNIIRYISKVLDIKDEKKNELMLKNELNCSNCGVCLISCPQNAIYYHEEKGNYFPIIDSLKCVKCGLCMKLCNNSIKKEYIERKAYIAYTKNDIDRLSAASGGIFTANARKIINAGGVAIGSSLDAREKVIRHIIIDSIDDLYKIQGSKYVKSDCTMIYMPIKQLLEKGMKVLFGGTSCQVDALYRFLGKDYDNLYTMDLVCHGTPNSKMFIDYLEHLEKKHKSKIDNYYFRNKKDSSIKYEEVVELINNKRLIIPYAESPYSNLFLRADNYMECCYHCKYATLSKPADITIGDYFEAKKDYPLMFDKNGKLKNIDYISCVITRTLKGEKLLHECNDIEYILIDEECVKNSHPQLYKSSSYTDLHKKIMQIYCKSGIKGIEKYLKLRNVSLFIPRIAKQYRTRRNQNEK